MGIQQEGDSQILDETIVLVKRERVVVGDGNKEEVYVPTNPLPTVPEGFRLSEPGKDSVAPDFVHGWREQE